MDFNPGVFQQQLNRVQLYKSTRYIMKDSSYTLSTNWDEATTLNIYQSININKCINHAPTCAKQPIINLYHKQLHPTMYQVYTNHVSTTHKQWIINMYQHHQLYTTCMCQLINCLSQPWPVLDWSTTPTWNNHNFVPVMNKDMKLIHNVLQCVYAIHLGGTTWNLSEKAL